MVLSGVRVLCEGTTIRAGLSVTGMLLGRRCRTGQSSTTSAPALPAAGEGAGHTRLCDEEEMGGEEDLGCFIAQRVTQAAELTKVIPLHCFINRNGMSDIFSCVKIHGTGETPGCLLRFSGAGQPQIASGFTCGFVVLRFLASSSNIVNVK